MQKFGVARRQLPDLDACLGPTPWFGYLSHLLFDTNFWLDYPLWYRCRVYAGSVVPSLPSLCTSLQLFYFIMFCSRISASPSLHVPTTASTLITKIRQFNLKTCIPDYSNINSVFCHCFWIVWYFILGFLFKNPHNMSWISNTMKCMFIRVHFADAMTTDLLQSENHYLSVSKVMRSVRSSLFKESMISFRQYKPASQNETTTIMTSWWQNQ